MKVEQIMETSVRTCRSGDPLSRAAQIMWESDCGVVPVVDDASKVVGMITDRDICMAGLTQGRQLERIEVASAMSRDVWSCSRDDSLVRAEELMRSKKVRRLPVTASDGRLVGLLSLADIAVVAVPPGGSKGGEGGFEEAGRVLAGICGPHLPVPTTSADSRKTAMPGSGP